jgi:acyl carrier protein
MRDVGMEGTIRSDIRKFIEDNFLFQIDNVELSDGQSLLEAGIVDSTGVLELVGFLEERFQLRIADADIIPENLDTIKAITRFVEAQLALQQDAINYSG